MHIHNLILLVLCYRSAFLHKLTPNNVFDMCYKIIATMKFIYKMLFIVVIELYYPISCTYINLKILVL